MYFRWIINMVHILLSLADYGMNDLSEAKVVLSSQMLIHEDCSFGNITEFLHIYYNDAS